jgi:oligopeptide transport system ATP-binding protein
MSNPNVLLDARGIKVHFPVRMGLMNLKHVKAVDGVDLQIEKGETFGLVGESGCGKTTLGRTVIRLQEPTEGTIAYGGRDITRADMLPYRRRIQIIYQDPYASLDPRMTVGDIVGEALDIHKLCKSARDRTDRIHQLLEIVGLNGEHMNRFPHEFSGGQRQRIGIARALAVEPEFIVCDEPISALDVSIQAQIVNMLEDLQAARGFTYLFIAHDLAVVKHISRRIGVMYLGHMVEVAPSNELYRHPQHPYTRTLLSAIPIADPEASSRKKRIILEGEIPSPIDPPSGCAFRTRCPYAKPECAQTTPALAEIAPGHFCACPGITR